MIKRKRKKRNKSSRPQIILSDSYAKKCIKMEIEYRDRSLSELYWGPSQTWLNAVH